MHRFPVARWAAPRLAASHLVLLAALAVSLASCADSPVTWSEERSATMPRTPVMLAIDGSLVSDTMAMFAARIAPPSSSVCPGSLTLARARRRVFAVWWSVRPDSGARLLSARTDDDGTSWSAAAAIDTSDLGVTGCRRAPPAIAADSTSGYVHVVYALQAKEGPGLFFAHSMDAGATFHAPVPIIYGERLGRSSVAADGDNVAVAFEDPNSTIPRVGLALSRTMGHIFEQRVVPLSSANGVAARPLTAVHGHRIAVAWERRPASDRAPAVLAIKTGVLH
jgi:hypothetical protein